MDPVCLSPHTVSVWAFPHSQLSSVAQSCPTLCEPMNRSTPGLPVHHQHPEFTQTHIHQVSDAIQPSHPLSSPSPPAPSPSQHQSFPMSQLFAWGGQSTGVPPFSISPSKEHPGLIPYSSPIPNLYERVNYHVSFLMLPKIWHIFHLSSNPYFKVPIEYVHVNSSPLPDLKHMFKTKISTFMSPSLRFLFLSSLFCDLFTWPE